MGIDLGKYYQEISAQLRETELQAAELRGQLRLIERLLADAQQPTLSGDPLGEELPANGKETHSGPLV